VSGPFNALDFLILAALVLVAVVGTGAVLTRDPVRQAPTLGMLGLSLALLFLLVQAPDVALSQLAVGAALTPLLILLTVRTVRRDAAARRRDRQSSGGQRNQP
jgi:uncharacterized MnhB-related membrane protein